MNVNKGAYLTFSFNDILYAAWKYCSTDDQSKYISIIISYFTDFGAYINSFPHLSMELLHNCANTNYTICEELIGIPVT